jgi:hypothetical protein
MLKSPPFVVPVDFSPEMEGTVSAAIALARKWGADVHLLEVVPLVAFTLLDDQADIRLVGRITSKRDWSRLEDSIHRCCELEEVIQIERMRLGIGRIQTPSCSTFHRSNPIWHSTLCTSPSSCHRSSCCRLQGGWEREASVPAY